MDDYRRDLPSEPPGEPIANGSFDSGRRILNDYEFADPSASAPSTTRRRRCSAVTMSRDPLLPFPGSVGARNADLRRAAGSGRAPGPDRRAYQTLDGHLERGQMDYQLLEVVDTGAVEYRIHAVSEMAELRNPFLYLGFRSGRRREQIHLLGDAVSAWRNSSGGPSKPAPLWSCGHGRFGAFGVTWRVGEIGPRPPCLRRRRRARQPDDGLVVPLLAAA